MTQGEVAAELGFSVASVSAWEKGRREPGLDALVALARVLGVGVGDFFPVVEGEPMTDRPLVQRVASLERQVKTLRQEHYAAVDELREEGLLAKVVAA